MTRTSTWIALGLCSVLICGCLGYRLTPAEVVQNTQEALKEMGACRSVLDLEIDTDLLKDSVSLELWEQNPGHLKIQVLSAVNPQLAGLVFTTDGEQSMYYSAHANQVLVGPADRVKLPSILEALIESRRAWVQSADPDQARIVAREREEGLVVYQVQIPIEGTGYAQYVVDARHWWVREVSYSDEYLGEGRIQVREIECFAELPAVRFELDIPAGVPISEIGVADNRPLSIAEAQMAVDFPLRTPVYLPAGTQFSVAYRLDKNVAMAYTGERSFTLVQGEDIGRIPEEKATPIPLRGRQAMMISDVEHGGVVLTWREGGLQFSIAGVLEPDEIVRIAESLDLASKNLEIDQSAEHTSEQGN